MTARDLRFGTVLFAGGSRAAWQDTARQAEDLGYDVILVADHIGRPAPFPALVSAAAVTTRPRLGTFVLNAAFYQPALLARDIATVDQLVDGRLEVGLGAGYARHEFEAAKVPFPRPGERIDHLTGTVTELRRLFDDDYHPRTTQRPAPPIMLAGQGDKVLTAAAGHADIVGFSGFNPTVVPTHGDQVDESALAERVAFLKAAAGPRFDSLELNLLLQAVAAEGAEPNLAFARSLAPGLADEALLSKPNVLRGSTQQMAETVHRYRETYGLTYFVANQLDMTSFASVMNRLR
ncbi:TIGR03621 family F420-dependent LLM class oxidoreductase [Kutzneria sp. NPDC051319]|uniref:TIGR03621 family F420-dependent LLM class oxidoreductase n=1 Tax=Kutzneria sp. NPDC051319 TaxID=3155047 RepID=UPI00344AB93F